MTGLNEAGNESRMMAAVKRGWPILAGLAIFCSLSLMSVVRPWRSSDKPRLELKFGPKGLERLSYSGRVLEDIEKFPSDAFHIWHMSTTSIGGRQLGNAEYGWGENASRKSWDLASRTWTYDFSWGRIRTTYEQSDDDLNVTVTEENRSGSNVLFEGATIYPTAIHMPTLPATLFSSRNSAIADNGDQPGVTYADFGTGEIGVVAEESSGLIYSGLEASPDNHGSTNVTYYAIVSGTKPEALGKTPGPVRSPLAPGQSDTFMISIRFAPSGTVWEKMAGDTLHSWVKQWPSTLQWKDRRIIGSIYLASSPSGDVSLSGGGTPGFENNPRRYLNDARADHFDINTEVGLERFQNRILEQAQRTVGYLRRLNAQGAITWDIEGEQYPQNTSYVCSPDLIATAAPEMESQVLGPISPYFGMKLDDAYFKTLRDAGFLVGVCVRPQHFIIAPDGRATQRTLSDNEAAAELIRKMRYAHDRWGAKLFYLDSTVKADGTHLSASVIEEAAAALPDSLLIPEESSPRMYRATAPFQTFLFHGDVGTPVWVRSVYQNAFSVNLINDADAEKLERATPQLTEAVRNGDVLMVHADSWQANNDTVIEIYRASQLAAP